MVHRRFGQMFAASAILLAGSCRQQPAQEPRNVSADRNAPAEVPSPSLTTPELDREALVIAGMRALTAAALGRGDAAVEAELKDRKFTIRSRFGCTATDAGPGTGWTYDPSTRTLRVKVQTDLASLAPLKTALLARGYEAAAGFSLAQPWLLLAGCPPLAFGATGAPQVAIAQFFTADDSRAQRPGAVLELTKETDPAEVPTSGLDLVVSGRIAPLSDGRAIHCAATEDSGGACIVSAKLDRLAIENPATATTLAEWGSW